MAPHQYHGERCDAQRAVYLSQVRISKGFRYRSVPICRTGPVLETHSLASAHVTCQFDTFCVVASSGTMFKHCSSLSLYWHNRLSGFLFPLRHLLLVSFPKYISLNKNGQVGAGATTLRRDATCCPTVQGDANPLYCQIPGGSVHSALRAHNHSGIGS
jgi:hypothetical protein